MNNQGPILKLKNIGKSFSGIAVLHDVCIDIFEGEVHGLVGENGAGKSTLIKIISGAYRADQGAVIYKNREIQNCTPRWARENGINTLYQEIDLVPDLSVAENISLGNEPIKRGLVDWAEVRRKAKKILDELDLNIDLNRPVGTLKVAHQQMVAIAKALALNTRVIIFDEPTAVFSSSEIGLLFEIIVRLKAQGIAIIYISHHLDEIFEIGDRVTVLRDGKFICSGPVGDFNKESIVKAMVGRDLDFTRHKQQTVAGDELLRVAGLGYKHVVKDINFSMHKGEIVAVAGLVGAGRTEMARLINGAQLPDSGTIYVRGQAEKISSPANALALGIGMVPENRKDEGIIPVRHMAENMGYSTVQSTARFGLVPWKKIKETVMKLITELQINPPNPNKQVCFLSGGNQQKVVLGKWLASRCDVLILDEPTRGVDVGAKSEIYKLMQNLKNEGKTILMISSDLPEVLTQSDRTLVMAQGRIVGEVPTAEATEEMILTMALGIGGDLNGSAGTNTAVVEMAEQ